MEQEITTWNLQVPKRLDSAVIAMIKNRNSHVSKSEFIRDIVRRELEKIQEGVT